MNKRVGGIVAMICLCLALVSGCKSNPGQGLKKVERTNHMMGTVVTLKVYVQDVGKGNRAIDKAFQRIREIENLMSLNVGSSEINSVNNAGDTGFVTVGQDTFTVIKRGVEYGELSGGLFDITIGPLVQLWGIGTDHPRVPGRDELARAIEKVDYRKVVLREDNRQVSLAQPGMLLDLGGIAKGYAAEQAKRVILSEGISHAIINLGGNVLTVGERYDGGSWNIGIQDPYAPTGGSMGVVRVKDKTVVTSGDYERFFEKEGRRYHHILDPRTGYPADNDLKGVTIIAPSSFDADALSTTVFLLGRQKGMELVEGLEGVETIMITKDREVFVSSGIGDAFSMFNGDYTMK